MPTAFPTRSELERMPLSKLRSFDIRTPEEERILQEVIDGKVEVMPDGGVKVKTSDVPDIRTPEEEAKWQKILDARRNKKKPKAVIKNKPEAAKGPSKSPAMTDYTITDRDLERNPDLVSRGMKAGDTVQIPEEIAKQVDTTTGIVAAGSAPRTTGAQAAAGKTKPRFCDLCTSKGGFHKQDCPVKALD